MHSAIPPTTSTLKQLEEIGPVQFVIAPNESHRLYFSAFLDAFPNAQGFIAPGLAEKRSDLRDFSTLDASAHAHWADDFDTVFVEGLPILNETVWFHRATCTLILTNLLFSFAPHPLGLSQVMARLLGVYDQVAMSRTMKTMIKDKDTLRESVALIKQWEVRRIILAHGQIIETDAADKLTKSFDWLTN